MSLAREMIRRTLPILLVLGAFILGTIIIRATFGMTPDETFRFLMHRLSEWGYPAVAVAAAIEATPGINLYLPGSGVILLAVAGSREPGGLNPGFIAVVATAAMILMHIVNYALGKYGLLHLFSVFGLRQRLEEEASAPKPNLKKWLAFSCFHPNAAAVAATVCGLTSTPFLLFLRVVALYTVLWNAGWTILAYLVGPKMPDLLQTPLVIAFFACWVLVVLLQVSFRNRRGSAPDGTDDESRPT